MPARFAGIMNRLYWVRHGENWANITKEFSHRKVDYPLTPKGVLQAQQTAEYFQDKGIHEIYSSPLKRAVETAEIIAAPLDLEVTIMENLREINVGSLEGRPPSARIWAFHNRVLQDWLTGRPETTFPGGENYCMLWDRLRSGIEQIAAGRTGQNIIVVSHGGILFVALKDLCQNIDLAWLLGRESHNCSITEMVIGLCDGRLAGKLIAWASYDHLHGAAADLISGAPEPETLEGR